jgi:hypothetical protein
VRALGGWTYEAIYRDSAETQRRPASWLDFYNRRRPHGALSHKPASPAYTSGTTSSGLTPSSSSLVSESIIDESCRSGAIDRSIATVKKALRERVGILAAALERELPDVRFTALGGCFLWLDLLSSRTRSTAS